MSQKASLRKPGPDMLKIAATIFVIAIHHKYYGNDPAFMKQFVTLLAILFVISLCIGTFFARRSSLHRENTSNCLFCFAIAVGCFFAFLFMRKFAVAIFMLVMGYLLAGSLRKHEKPFRMWYTRQNIIVRIMRFYLPFVPIFIVGLVYKIIFKDYTYSLLEVIARFFLGGFKPGSYYITILAETVLIFPIIYFVVKRFKTVGVFAMIAVNLIYDVLCTYLGMNDVLYKFLVFRFIAHIALGIYGSITDFNHDKKFNTTLFTVGLAYVCIYVYSGVYSPSLFFQWKGASFPVALFMYVPVMWFINKTQNFSYSNTKLSKAAMTFANATYHIFLIQLLYYTTFGFEFNAWVNNVALTMPLNILITVSLGIGYYKLVSPIEKLISDKVSTKLKKS